MKELPKIKDKMKKFNFMLGDKTHFRLINPTKAVKQSKHMDTDYYYFDCEVISKDLELIPYGRHTIQLPSKRVVIPMLDKIHQVGRLDDKVEITILKTSKACFEIIIHKNNTTTE